MPLASFRVGQTSSQNGEDDKAGKKPEGFSPTHELHHDRYHCYGTTVFHLS